MQSKKPDQTDNDLTTLNYLKNDPDFFVRHPTALSELNLPHPSGEAVSLIQRQIEVLRERNADMRRRMDNLLQAARTNNELFSKTRKLNLALFEANSWHELNEVLATHVLVDFDADFVCCHLLDEVLDDSTELALDHIRSHYDTIPFQNLVASDEPVCSTLREEELSLIFPQTTHNETGSAVLLPLGLNASTGILAIGSRDSQRFVQHLDTLFVQYIADVLSKVMNRLNS